MAFPALYGLQHMSFFYLPDEVKYHRLPANRFSLPKDFECDRFEVATAAVRAQSTSSFSEADFVCAPGEVNPHCILVYSSKLLHISVYNYNVKVIWSVLYKYLWSIEVLTY